MVQDELWASLKRKLREVTTAAADFTEEQARIGKLKFEILTLKRRIDGELRSLGARVLELSRKSPPSANPLHYESGKPNTRSHRLLIASRYF